MKIAKINERYDVLYDHAREFPQFAKNLWILVDKYNSTKEVDLFLITEETFDDGCYDITREKIIAAMTDGSGETMGFIPHFFRKIHDLGNLYKINTFRRAWTISFYMHDVFNERRYIEAGRTVVYGVCDAYSAYCEACNDFLIFRDLIVALDSIICDWYVDVVPHRRSEI